MSHLSPHKPTPRSPAGFVGEMRKVAMKLHTREQAPKEGGTDAPKPPQPQAWVPTRIGYARFLAESKVVFGAFESVMTAADGHPECEYMSCF
jgi:heme oxygenase (biliverdin-producing, ferredoxin)